MLFVLLELSSLTSLAFMDRWWLPGTLFASALVTAPLVSGAGFNLGYTIYGVGMFAAAMRLGRAGSAKRNGS